MGIEHRGVQAASHVPGVSNSPETWNRQSLATDDEKLNGNNAPTAVISSTNYPVFQRRKKVTLTDITQFEQYGRANYRGALQEYFQKFRPNIQLHFESIKDESENVFVSTCKVDEVVGVGRARTKKQAIQLAALDIISKVDLETAKGSKRLCSRNLDVGTNAVVSISENDQYKRDNFRGALLEHFQKLGRENNLVFNTTRQFPDRFISTCSIKENLGTGIAGSKKKAIQLAAFDLICKLKLLSNEEVERQRERQKKKEVRNFGTQISVNNLSSQTIPSIVLSDKYRKNCFISILQLYFKKLGRDITPSFDTVAQSNKSFISKCVIDGVEGTGQASNKTEAMQLAAQDLIVKLKVPVYETTKRFHEYKREIRKRRRIWKSAGLLYILPSAKAKNIVEHFAVKEQTNSGYRCLLPVPLSVLLARGHEKCRPFRCLPDLCQIRTWMMENVPKQIMSEFGDNHISGGFPCKFFTKLYEKNLISRLNSIRSTHSAICGLETHRSSSRSRQRYRIVNMSFTGWGKREEKDKDSMETARRETLEECGIDIEKASWSVKLRRISFGEPLYFFIDMAKEES